MWEEVLRRLDRKKACITFDPHVFDRVWYWKLNPSKVEETVRTGYLFKKKCRFPNILCFTRYFGKENTTYVVIVRYHYYHIEVKTVWPRKGK